VRSGFSRLVEKPMLNNTFQLVFKGGDMCRFAFFDSAIQLALHWKIDVHPSYLEPNSESMQKPIGGLSVLALFTTNSMLKVEPKLPSLNKGAIDCTEHNSSRQIQPMRSDAFYKDIANKKSPNTEVAQVPKIKVALIGVGNCASAFIQGLH